MSLDDATDPLVDALRALAKDEVSRLLAGVTGADAPAVIDTRGYPAPLELLEQMRLPCMCVYVQAETSVRTTMRHLDTRCEVVFEYVLPATPLAKLDGRWPMLRAAWAALLEALNGGEIDDTPVLSGFGVTHVDVDHASAKYSFAAGGELAYPVFVGTVPITVRPAEALPTQELVELVAGINRVVEDGANPDIQPQVELTLRPDP